MGGKGGGGNYLRKMTYNNMSQACIISILESRAYILYIRKTDDVLYTYRMAGNFGGKIFWRIAENMSFGGIYFGG